MFDYATQSQQPLTEIEVFVGNILGRTGAQTRRQRELSMTMKQRFDEDLAFTIKCMTERDNAYYDDEDERESAYGVVTMDREEKALAISMACLWIALNDKKTKIECGKRGLVEIRSFGYVAAAVCLKELYTHSVKNW